MPLPAFRCARCGASSLPGGKYLTYHFIAYLCLSIQGFAFLTWVVEFFVRKHHWTRTEIGPHLRRHRLGGGRHRQRLGRPSTPGV